MKKVILLITFTVFITGCISSSPSIENYEAQGDVDLSFEGENYNEVSYNDYSVVGVGYEKTDDNMYVFVKGTAPATNYDIRVTDMYLTGENTLVVNTEVEQVGSIGGSAITYPSHVVKVEGVNLEDINTIKHVFSNNGENEVSINTN